MVFYDIRHDKVSSGATHLSAATGAATANNRQGARRSTPLGLRQSFYERNAARHLPSFIIFWIFFQFLALLRLRCVAKYCVFSRTTSSTTMCMHNVCFELLFHFIHSFCFYFCFPHCSPKRIIFSFRSFLCTPTSTHLPHSPNYLTRNKYGLICFTLRPTTTTRPNYQPTNQPTCQLIICPPRTQQSHGEAALW